VTRASLAAAVLAVIGVFPTHSHEQQRARATAAAAKPSVPRPLAFTRTVLPNGLVLIVSEDHSVPLVSVEVSYHVGSMEDTPGHTGFAHLFEHMMGEGSRDLAPGEYKSVIQLAGGFNLGATDPDRQVYRTTVASNMLPTVLWMEADRMATLLERMDQQRLDAERAIIRNERLQQFENVPYGTANLFTLAALFPPNHPFHQSPIGTPADLASATLDDLRAFYKKYYVPNNAVVAISGDVTPASARALTMKYFAPVPRGATVVHSPARPVRMASEQRLVLQDPRISAPRLRMAWPTVGYGNPDKFALEALSALLGGDRTGRLRHALVIDTALAVNVRIGHYDNEKNGLFQIDVFARPGTSLTALERAVDSVLADIPLHPPTARDIRDYVSRITDSTVVALEPTIERADILAMGEQFAGNPVDYDRQLAGRAKVTPADIVRAARQYLGAGRMVMSMVPAGKLDLISKPELPYVDVTPRAGTVGGAQ
jgi:zinc protease